MATPSAFTFKDISVIIQNNLIVEFSEISYKKIKPKQNNTGRGGRVVSRGRGGESFEFSCSMAMREVMKIRNAMPSGKDETDLAPFDVPVTYTNDDGQVVTDLIKDLEFTEAVGGASRGDLEIVHVMPALPADITFNKRA